MTLGSAGRPSAARRGAGLCLVDCAVSPTLDCGRGCSRGPLRQDAGRSPSRLSGRSATGRTTSVFVPGFASNVEHMWRVEPFARGLRRLGSVRSRRRLRSPRHRPLRSVPIVGACRPSKRRWMTSGAVMVRGRCRARRAVRLRARREPVRRVRRRPAVHASSRCVLHGSAAARGLPDARLPLGVDARSGGTPTSTASTAAGARRRWRITSRVAGTTDARRATPAFRQRARRRSSAPLPAPAPRSYSSGCYVTRTSATCCRRSRSPCSSRSGLHVEIASNR